MVRLTIWKLKYLVNRAGQINEFDLILSESEREKKGTENTRENVHIINCNDL